MSVSDLSESVARGVADIAEMAAHCAVTVNARLPILAGCFFLPTKSGLDEWHEAVTEKMAAAVEGTLAAGGEMGSALLRSAFQPPTPVGLAGDLVRVLDKAAHPARARAKANALRFSQAR